MTIHATTCEHYDHALNRARKWRMLHPVDAQRASSPEAADHGYYVGPLMRRESDGVLWYGDSPDDYPAPGSTESTVTELARRRNPAR